MDKSYSPTDIIEEFCKLVVELRDTTKISEDTWHKLIHKYPNARYELTIRDVDRKLRSKKKVRKQKPGKHDSDFGSIAPIGRILDW